MESKSKYVLTRLNDVLSKSNLQPTLRDLERRCEQISRGIKSVETSHMVIRDNLTETKHNLKRREDLMWLRSGSDTSVNKTNKETTDANTDEDEPLSPAPVLPSDSTSHLIESKMLGLQINLSVLSPPPTTATQFFPEKGNVSCGGAEVVSLISPTFPLSSAVIEPPGTTDSSKSDTTLLATCQNVELKLDDEVLVMRKSKNWSPGIVVHINCQSKLFHVSGDGFHEKGVPKNKLCLFKNQSDISIGARIVALYGQLGIYYAGITAETPCEQNANRILVFFDDGFAQYLHSDNVYLVAKSSECVWEEVDKPCREFIKRYLTMFPRRRMLRLRISDEITTEWRGEWCKPCIVSVDCSLARVHFTDHNIKEWIYRGSTRFRVLYNCLTSDTKESQLITRNKHIITHMLYDSLCPPSIEASNTNTGIMDSSFQSDTTIGESKEETDAIGTEEQQKSYDFEISSTTLANGDSIEDLTEDNYEVEESSSYYNSAEGSDHDSDYTECLTYGTNKSIVPVLKPVIETEETPSPIEEHPPEGSLSNVRVTRSKWRNINKPNIILAPRVGWEPGTINTKTYKNPCQTDNEKAVLFNNHSYSTSSHYNSTLESEAIEESINFWLTETNKLELKTQSEIQTNGVTHPFNMSPLNEPFEEFILSEHSYSKFSSIHRPTQIRKSHNRVTLGDPRSCVYRRSIYGDELTYPDATFTPHECGTVCASTAVLNQSLQPINYLSIPIFLGWRRELNFQPHKSKPVHVYYTAPCTRRLRSLDEIEFYIHLTQTRNVSIDMFSLDTSIDIQNSVISINSPKLFVGDLTLGVERLPIPFINELDTKPLPPLHYTTKRICYPGVNINTNNEFMTCCDCTDDCQDKSKCSCCLLTAEVSRSKDFYGYQNRRLVSSCGVAIYECNSRCHCSPNCGNKVIQNGIQTRLHVFKTENKGWGIKCIDDIPKGAFICTYAGYIYNDEMANERGVDFGDDYLAELDYLDVMETKKEGYEPFYGSLLFSKENDEVTIKEPETGTKNTEELNSEFVDSNQVNNQMELSRNIRVSEPIQFMEIQDVILLDSHSESDLDSSASEQQLEETVVTNADNIMVEIVDNESEALIESTKLGMIEDRFPKEWCGIALRMTQGDVSQAAELLEKADKMLFDSNPSLHEGPQQLLLAVSKDTSEHTSVTESSSEGELPLITRVCGSYPEKSITDCSDVLVISDEEDWISSISNQELFFPHNTTIPPAFHCPIITYQSIRSLHREKGAYVMDAKFVGNIGRYFNHSCQPNIFTHTVFLDTHDLRFPWVAFFAKKRIKANTELTWDYNYEIGSVPNKVLQCLCGTPKCRGRLL